MEYPVTRKDIIVFIHQIYGQRDGNIFDISPIMISFLDIGVRASTDAESTCKTRTLSAFSCALVHTQVVELCGKYDYLTRRDARRSAMNLSIDKACSLGSGYCFKTKYFESVFISISYRVPISLGSLQGTDSGHSRI